MPKDRVMCLCGKSGTRMEIRIHRELLKPIAPPQPSPLLPWLTQEKSDKLNQEFSVRLNEFFDKHGSHEPTSQFA